MPVTTGVPQGSVFGSLLFHRYTADIPVIAEKHNFGVHCYADDGQLYVSDKAALAQNLVSRVATCFEEIDEWMSSNRLKLNTDKTQFIWLGSRQQLQKVGVNAVHLGTDVVNFQTTVGNLGETIDSQMTMKAHVQRICRTSFYKLRQLRVAARLVMRKGEFDPISDDIRDHLHWLPIPQRVQFKLGLLVYKCLHGDAPPYLVEMLVQNSDVPAFRSLRSTARGCLVIPRTKTVTIGPRSFASTGPTFWNSLPTHLRDDLISLPCFKSF